MPACYTGMSCSILEANVRHVGPRPWLLEPDGTKRNDLVGNRTLRPV